MNSKTILVIAYFFPPMQNGGTERMWQFYKRLKKDNYRVIVITANSSGANVNNIEDSIEYIKTPSRYYKKMLWMILRVFERTARFLSIPITSYWLWKLKAKRKVKKIIKAEKIDVCLSSYGPLENIEIGNWIKKKHPDIKLITDYRDGLLYEPFEKYIKMRSYERRCRKAESQSVELSDYITTVTPDISSYFSDTYKCRNIKTISNGFDESYVCNGKSLFKNNKEFTVLYTGGLDSSRRGTFDYSKTFLSVLFDRCPYSFVFVGEYTDYEKAFFNKYTNVHVFDKQAHDTVLATQRDANVLLLVTGELKSGTSGKLFEYIFANKPILNVGINNNGAQIIKYTQTGMTFSCFESEKALEYLTRIATGEYVNNRINHMEFSREHQYNQLKSILKTF